LINLYAAMLVTLGFLIAALILVVLLPAYRRRVERFTTEALKRRLPLTEEEIRADKDRLRADFAMEVHRLESKLEEAGLMSARQRVEVNRRDARIQELTEAIADQKMSVEEHENARRVLEQAILDRLPKVEQRLTETRKLLATRDREIKTLSATGAKQAAALEEASQLNKQREKELAQLRTALDTRAVRNRDSLKDPGTDANVALRTELESLREKSREQASLIERLQATVQTASSSEQNAEIKRLMLLLAKTEAELNGLKASIGGEDAERMALEDRIADLQFVSDGKSTELAKLKAMMQAYEERDQPVGDFAQKAELGTMQAEIEHQKRVIAELRAEIAAGQERLSRQALRFHEEVRRIAPTPSDEPSEDLAPPPRPSLAERISAPRTPRPAANDVEGAGNGNGAREPRQGGFLRALNSAAVNGSPETVVADASQPPPLPSHDVGGLSDDKAGARRPRLLERISGLDKN
jgi:chromosome segregation ATPase